MGPSAWNPALLMGDTWETLQPHSLSQGGGTGMGTKVPAAGWDTQVTT